MSSSPKPESAMAGRNKRAGEKEGGGAGRALGKLQRLRRRYLRQSVVLVSRVSKLTVLTGAIREHELVERADFLPLGGLVCTSKGVPRSKRNALFHRTTTGR